MDAVQSFNNELGSMFETKPPISKAKMTSVTKAAIKAIKFYKHVVQSVEKFIQKSRAEYKVPGLYVIDSIVRQSRHQFGAEKDVYAVRFSKNFTSTFQHLFKCPVEEKSKIVRVLNLWQKNNVFSSEVIQPLLDMANPNHVIHQQSTPSSNLGTPTFTNKKGDGSGWSSLHDTPQNSQSDPSLALKTVSQMLQQSNAMTTSDSILQGGSNSNTMTAVDSNLVLQLQQITSLLTQQQNYMKPEPETTVKFNKKLLAFDYGDEDDEDEDPRREETPVQDNASLAVSMAQNLLSNPDILRQLQQMQQTIQQTEALKTEVSLQEQLHKQRFRAAEEEFASQIPAQSLFSAQMLQASQLIQEAAYNQTLSQAAMVAGPTLSAQLVASPSPVNMMAVAAPTSSAVLSAPPGFVPIPPVVQEPAYTSDMFPAMEEERRASVEEESGSEREKDDRGNNEVEEERQDRVRSPRFREKSRSPVPIPTSRTKRRGPTRKSRSRSRSPKRRVRSKSRSRSRSRSKTRYKRDRDRERSREREKEKEKERERERKKRGLPPIKKEFISVCSTTLWLGHVSKLVSQEDLADAFGEIGDIVAIDLIPPRGCAFVCMNRRQDAFKALYKLKNLKLQGKTITMAWAPGKGVKGKDFKDYWDVELGVSYIPWDKLPDDIDVDALEDGGMIDEETIPERLRERMAEKTRRVVKDVDLRDSVASERSSAGLATPTSSVVTTRDASHTMQTAVAVMPSMVQPSMVQQPYGLTGIVTGQALSMIQLPMGVPTPGQLMMVPPVGQSLLGQAMPVMTMVGQHYGMPPNVTTTAPLPTSAVPSDVLPPLPLDNPGEERASGRETADSTSTDVSQSTMSIQTSTIPMPSGQPAMTPTRLEQLDISVPPSPHNMHLGQGPPLPGMPPGGHPLSSFQQLQPPPPPFNMSMPLLPRPPGFRMQHPSLEHIRPPVSLGGMLGQGPRSGPPRDMMDGKDERRRSMERDPWDRMNMQDVEMAEYPKDDDSPRHRHPKHGVSPQRSMIAPPPMVPMTLARHINAGQEMLDVGQRSMLDRMGPPRDEKESHGRFGHPPPFQGGIPPPMGRFPTPRMQGGPGVAAPRQPFMRFPQGPGGPGPAHGPTSGGHGHVPRGPGPVPRLPGHAPGPMQQHHPMQPPPQPRGMMIGYPRGPGPGQGPGPHYMRPARPPDMNDFGMRGPPQPHHMPRLQRPYDDRFGRHEFDNGETERRLASHHQQQRQRLPQHAFNRGEEDMGSLEEFGDRGGDWRRERGRGRGMGGPGRERFGRGGFNPEERFSERYEREWEPREQGGGWDYGGKRNRGRERDQAPGERSFRADRDRERDRERDRDRSGESWDRDDQQRDRGGRRSRWCETSPSKASEEGAENPAAPENGPTEAKTKDCDEKVSEKDTSNGTSEGNGPSASHDVPEAEVAMEIAIDA